MLKNQINLNTYLNILIVIIMSFFSYVALQYEKRFDNISNQFVGVSDRFDAVSDRFDKVSDRFDKLEAKIDQVISMINNNRINIVRIEEKQNYIDKRLKNVETSLNFKTLRK